MTRRPALALAAILVVAALVATAIVVTRPDGDAGSDAGAGAGRTDLTLLVVRTAIGPFAAVVGTTGGRAGALAVPTNISVTVPGQGDARLDDALELPGRTAATTVANTLGIWIDRYAVLGRLRLAALVDRAGGIEIGNGVRTGDEVVEMLESAGGGRALAFQSVLDGLLDAAPPWTEDDLAEADDPKAAVTALEAAAGARVTTVPVAEPAPGIFRAEPAAIRDAIVDAFGGPDRDVVGVIVLNGSGAPGVGEAVAERIVPGGFSVVVSENAQTFDHEETLVVVGSSADVGLGGRVRDLLGVGTVNVSVNSGLAPVTVVVGKDFRG